MVLCAGSHESDFSIVFFVWFCGSDNTSVTDLADFVCKGTFCAESTRFLVRKKENKATSISGGRFRNRIVLTLFTVIGEFHHSYVQISTCSF